MSKVNNKDFEHTPQLQFADFEQVNTSWVLRVSFTDKTKAFFHLLKSDANSEAVIHLR